MKVIFVDDSNVPPKAIIPKIGEIVTASQCETYSDNYNISEYPYYVDGRPQSFKKIRFIPLSDIDETELVKERELVC